MQKIGDRTKNMQNFVRFYATSDANISGTSQDIRNRKDGIENNSSRV